MWDIGQGPAFHLRRRLFCPHQRASVSPCDSRRPVRSLKGGEKKARNSQWPRRVLSRKPVCMPVSQAQVRIRSLSCTLSQGPVAGLASRQAGN